MVLLNRTIIIQHFQGCNHLCFHFMWVNSREKKQEISFFFCHKNSRSSFLYIH